MIIDPIADKLLIGSILALGTTGRVPRRVQIILASIALESSTMALGIALGARGKDPTCQRLRQGQDGHAERGGDLFLVAGIFNFIR